MIKTNLLIITTITSLMLLATITSGSYPGNVFGAVKPDFPNTDLGNVCSTIFDLIQELRAKSDRQGGQLSGDDQAALDGHVTAYNLICRPHFGGNPRPAGETGIDNPRPTEETGILDDGTGVSNPGATLNDPGATLNPQQAIEEQSKPSFTKKLPFGLKLDLQKLPSSELAPSGTAPYKVKVTFASVTVHNDHEGGLSGDGEYDLNAYVHGKLVKLTDMSRSAGAAGLWDVSSGETVKFPPGSEITVDIDKTLPLSIFTVGSEVDGCDRTAFPADIQSKVVSVLEKGINYLIPLGSIQNELDKAINWVGCKLNPNDDIGDIIKSYNPTGYGAGPHTDKSDEGDFTLRYTISVTAPPAPSTPSPTIK